MVTDTPQPITISPTARWTAVRTRARCEKQVAGFCEGRGFAHYLPLRRRAKRYQRRTVETWLPMFPGYLFAQLSPEDATVLVQCGKVVTILRVAPPQEIGLVQQLRDIQCIEAQSRTHEVEVHPELVAGRAVLITAGPMAGTTGIVERRTHQTVVTINVEILGQAVAVILDAGDVDLIE